MKRRRAIIVIFIAVIAGALFFFLQNKTPEQLKSLKLGEITTQDPEIRNNPLSIERMQAQSYPGSTITTERTLPDGSNYTQSVVSYKSEGLQINALLTIPTGKAPATGWPVIIFNHGYIQPTDYRTTERYVAYLDGFARNGYIVFKSDYRGHGSSEGNPEGAYFSPAYTIDVLNAVGSLKRFKDADPDRIGMWGHSLGGNITQRVITVSKDIKAAVIWGGVVSSYKDMYELWFNQRQRTPEASAQIQEHWRVGRVNFTKLHGTPTSNPEFWKTIDPIAHLNYFNTPVQLHHSRGDETVNYRLSEELVKTLTKAGKPNEVYLYEGDNHNISANFNTAMERSLEFFDKYLK